MQEEGNILKRTATARIEILLSSSGAEALGIDLVMRSRQFKISVYATSPTSFSQHSATCQRRQKLPALPASEGSLACYTAHQSINAMADCNL
eukprot:857610-Amphidinium_carterae.1